MENISSRGMDDISRTTLMIKGRHKSNEALGNPGTPDIMLLVHDTACAYNALIKYLCKTLCRSTKTSMTN